MKRYGEFGLYEQRDIEIDLEKLKEEDKKGENAYINSKIQDQEISIDIDTNSKLISDIYDTKKSSDRIKTNTKPKDQFLEKENINNNYSEGEIEDIKKFLGIISNTDKTDSVGGFRL